MTKKLCFVVQKHNSTHLHYDFRLELQGVLKSWAVPKGMPETFKDKRLAILTEDHNLSYATFEGIIPEGHYGAGTVEIYDTGTYENLKTSPIATCFKEGVIEIEVYGTKLKGRYALVHIEDKKWLLMKLPKKSL